MHAWDRWDRVWHWLFAGVLALPTVMALARGDWLTAAIAAGFGAWYVLLVLRRRDCWERLRPMTLYAAGAIAFLAVLVARDGAYFYVLYGLWPQLFLVLGAWGAVAGGAATLAAFLASGAEFDGAGDVAALAASVAMAGVIGLFIVAIAGQSERRADAIAELERARAALAAALEENRRLLERAREAGVLEERRRLARDLHDTIAQGLASIVMQLEAADATLATGPARERVERARRTAREALAETRRVVHALGPIALEQASLPDALDRLVGRWAQETGVSARTRVTGTPAPLHADVEVTLLRAAQEALANVSRHAGARTVTVTLSYMGDVATLDVHDDGAGFDPAARPGPGGGVGLPAMRERAAALGGSVEVESARGAGTTLVVTVPAA